MGNTGKQGLATEILHSLKKKNCGLKIALALSMVFNIIMVHGYRRL